MDTSPLVTVIIPTYNRSNVLSYAIRSVLWQTLQDFELLVIGDGCTDDSEQVVTSFGDSRIHWHNLPENTGEYSTANNFGLKMARGRFVAYLGHDDLWHPDHLQLLSEALIKTNADLVYSMSVINDAGNTFSLTGLTLTGQYERLLDINPGTVMHRHELTDDIGGWRDARSLYIPPYEEFVNRAWEQGKQLRFVPELTLFKINAGTRRDVYRERPFHEQAEYFERIQHEPEIRYHELMRALQTPAFLGNPIRKFHVSNAARLGLLVETWRGIKGLPMRPLLDETLSIEENIGLLKEINQDTDITPPEYLKTLIERGSLPLDGLFIGRYWHPCEFFNDPEGFRWVENDAQIVITRPTGDLTRLILEVSPGPGLRETVGKIQVRHQAQLVGEIMLTHEHQVVEFEIPLTPEQSTVFELHTEDGGQSHPGDPRILNFRVHRLYWGIEESKSASEVLSSP